MLEVRHQRENSPPDEPWLRGPAIEVDGGGLPGRGGMPARTHLAGSGRRSEVRSAAAIGAVCPRGASFYLPNSPRAMGRGYRIRRNGIRTGWGRGELVSASRPRPDAPAVGCPWGAGGMAETTKTVNEEIVFGRDVASVRDATVHIRLEGTSLAGAPARASGSGSRTTTPTTPVTHGRFCLSPRTSARTRRKRPPDTPAHRSGESATLPTRMRISDAEESRWPW
jgi:hypothetical protein